MDSSSLTITTVGRLIGSATPKRIPWTTDCVSRTIKEHTVVVFGRGTLEEPKCGFTARTIDHLNEKGLEFLFIDVTADKSIIPAVIAMYGRCHFPSVVLNGELIEDFDKLCCATQSFLGVANA